MPADQLHVPPGEKIKPVKLARSVSEGHEKLVIWLRDGGGIHQAPEVAVAPSSHSSCCGLIVVAGIAPPRGDVEVDRVVNRVLLQERQHPRQWTERLASIKRADRRVDMM